MSGANSFGSRFVVTSFGESHGAALGAVIDGCPAGLDFDNELLLHELARRRPGQSRITTSRQEADLPEILSGVYEGRTLGTPIAILVRNTDARPDDYRQVALQPRPGHADAAWRSKFGHVDPRGGGRSSGRETVTRVLGGAVARMLLRKICPELRITGFASTLGPFQLTSSERAEIRDSGQVDGFISRLPSPAKAAEIETFLLKAKEEGKSYGGTAELWLDGVAAGLGQPLFKKLKSELAGAFMSVGAAAGVELGAGFSSTDQEGSGFHSRGAGFEGYGGLSGGITTGDRISFRVAFKPTSSVLDIAKRGRHDPCIVPRAIPVLEAMAALVLADHALWARTDRI